jgi:hypothetical protein
MRFQVPQFIESETKAIGPLTFTQAAWIGIGSFLVFIAFTLFPTVIGIIATLIIGPIFLALAFMKVNDVPLAIYITRFFGYMINPKRYKYKR